MPKEKPLMSSAAFLFDILRYILANTNLTINHYFALAHSAITCSFMRT